ncbi:MAG TPA: DUF2914 domain-containing protein [Kofleriaceae bacterium]|nr:DUF2914 domain-containing protein [Kofleriaceae bacterium]
MWNRFSVVVVCLGVGLWLGLAAGSAQAQAPATQPTPAAPSSSAGATAEVKAAKGVANREPVEEGTTFAAGTTVWCWSLIRNSEGAAKHVWKKDGKAVWTANHKVASKRWTTYSRRKLNKPGSYSVDVLGADDAVLGSVSFTIE